ncbi:hypothetical protein ACFRMN_10865 [Streptomyces sp. NPDC056835]|uniref:hypothetical protein n=1 Tax=Streptomyces sp. NPDC056835 TaxID=3345956 RepID=UPI003675D67F
MVSVARGEFRVHTSPYHRRHRPGLPELRRTRGTGCHRPAAHARGPGHRPSGGQRRAAGHPVYLVETATNTGVGIQVWGNYDYLRLSRAGALADKVILHRQGDGVIIEHSTGHWDGYRFWQSSGNGIFLAQRSSATVYTVHLTDKGFLFKTKEGASATYPSYGKRWLTDYKYVMPNHQELAYFRFQK